MMNVLIADDEPLARQRLRRQIERLQDCRCVGEAGNGQEAIGLARSEQPDVVILDIEMPDLDGLQAASEFADMRPQPVVIFCTAHQQHALQAFDLKASDYLMKPVHIDRLRQAISRARLVVAASRQQQLANQDFTQYIGARVRGDWVRIPLDNVSHFSAEDKYVVAHTGERDYILDASLAGLQEDYPDRYLRVHRNALVASNRILSLEKNLAGGHCVRLKDCEECVEVSRRNLPAVRSILRSK